MYRILFVDDEPTSKIICQSLADWSSIRLQIVASASNGQEALTYMDTHEIDGVIADLQMPVMDGLTFIQKLRERHFAGPILALSNYSDYNLVRGALTAGAYDYLIKFGTNKNDFEKALKQMVDILDTQQGADHYDADGPVSGDLLQSVLYPYLINPHAQIPDALQSCMLEFPVSACLIEVFLRNGHKIDLLQFLRSCCAGLFSSSDSFHLIQMSDTEFLLLFSEKDTSRKTANKAAALGRQINTFLSVDYLISFTPELEDYPSLQQFFRLGTHGNVCSFYGFRNGVIQLHPLNINKEFHRQRELFITSTISAIRGHDAAAIQSCFDSFVDFCFRMTIEPYRLKNTFSILLWCSLDIGEINISKEPLEELASEIEQSVTAKSARNLLIDFLDAHISFDNRPSGPIHPEIAKVLFYVYKNYPKHITLNEVASYAGLSKEYLSRLFLKEMGVNLFQYILKVRMIKAKEFIHRNPSIRIKKVAYSVGFDNPYFFSSKFKEYFGISPNQYRSSLLPADEQKELENDEPEQA